MASDLRSPPECRLPIRGRSGGAGDPERARSPARRLRQRPRRSRRAREATDSAGRLFSEERLVDLIASRRFASAEDAVHAIRATVEEFELGTVQADDVTVLAVRLEGGGRE